MANPEQFAAMHGLRRLIHAARAAGLLCRAEGASPVEAFAAFLEAEGLDAAPATRLAYDSGVRCVRRAAECGPEAHACAVLGDAYAVGQAIARRGGDKPAQDIALGLRALDLPSDNWSASASLAVLAGLGDRPDLLAQAARSLPADTTTDPNAA